jgi:hypothetical protein
LRNQFAKESGFNLFIVSTAIYKTKPSQEPPPIINRTPPPKKTPQNKTKTI